MDPPRYRDVVILLFVSYYSILLSLLTIWSLCDISDK